MNQTVVAVFNTQGEAQAALEQLVTRGFDRSDIEIKSGPTSGGTTGTTGTTAGMTPTTGATTPASAHTDEGFFGSIGHFFGNMFGSDDDERGYAGHYTEAVRRGSAVLTLRTEEARVDAAHDALQLAGAVDIDEEVGTWKQSGYSGTASGVAGSTTSSSMGSSSALADGNTVVPVIAEELEVGKRMVQGGVVRVTSRVTTRPVQESVDLTRETASIERRPVDRDATQADLAGFQDRTVEVKESAEKAVVNKSSRVVEEVVVGKQVSHETQKIEETLRRTEVDVDRGSAEINKVGTTGVDSATSATPFPNRTTTPNPKL